MIAQLLVEVLIACCCMTLMLLLVEVLVLVVVAVAVVGVGRLAATGSGDTAGLGNATRCNGKEPAAEEASGLLA